MTGDGPGNDRRKGQREPCDRTRIITDSRGEILCFCTIDNMSSESALISLPAARRLPSEIGLVSLDREIESACAVIWRIGNQIGLNYMPQFSTNAEAGVAMDDTISRGRDYVASPKEANSCRVTALQSPLACC